MLNLKCCPSWNDNEVLAELGEVAAIADGFPVSSGHSLIIPKRHVESFFDLNEIEIIQLHVLAREVKEKFPADGYTIGVNDGIAAGRTIHHMHMHIIPRFTNDVVYPEGGVRRLLTQPEEIRWNREVNLKQWNSFWAKVDKDGPYSDKMKSYCWLWTGVMFQETRQGRTSINAFSSTRAHIVAYKLTKGDYDNGLWLKHLCEERSCVNPNHMELTSDISSFHTKKTHCVHGHKFTESNTYRYRGRISCDLCRKNIMRRARGLPLLDYVEE